MKVSALKKSEEKIIIKKCHICGHLNESQKEIERCQKCHKAFLPLNYFLKVHEKTNSSCYRELFASSQQLDEEDLIRGIYVLW